jgi:DNA-directed RNA polymerase subunit M/transcription elongation factor TFIIS
MALPKLAIPKYTLTIPSTQVEVEFRPYLVGEEKVLMIAAESGNETVMMKAMVDIIERCVTQDINSKKLKLYDVEYIFTQLKSKSAGESSEVIIKCTECEEPNTIALNVDNDVTVTNLLSKKDDFKIDITKDIGIALRHLTMEDTLNDSNDKSPTNQVFSKIVQCIDYIYEGDTIYDVREEGREEMYTFIESLNTKQFKLLSDFIENMPRVELNSKFKCTKCGKNNKVKLVGIDNFF